MAAQELVCFVAQIVVALRCGEFGHVGTQCAHILINRHIIVVEHDQHIVGVRRHIVQTLKRQTATDGGIADDSHNFALLIGQFRGNRHAQCG